MEQLASVQIMQVKESLRAQKENLKKSIQPAYPIAIQSSRQSDKHDWCAKTINTTHNCVKTRELCMLTMSTLAREIEPILVDNPHIEILDLQNLVKKTQGTCFNPQNMYIKDDGYKREGWKL